MTTLPAPYALPYRRAVPRRPDLSALTRAFADNRRALQLTLGMIWLLDAALQYQPYMFTKGFVSQVIQNGASGNPAVIAGPITWSATFMAQHIVFCNAVFATIQLLIAGGLLYRPTARAALAASIPWAIGVWWIGEGLSGMLAGTASPFMGAPGAVILYVFLALLAWPPAPAHPGSAPVLGSVATTGRLGRTLPRVMWAALWGSLAGFALQPANRSPSGLAAMLSGMKAGEPAWISAMDGFGSRVLAHHGTAAAIIVAVLCALAATGVASGRLTRVAVIVAAILGAMFWVTENFGAIFTGQGTDPNSGLLLIVLAAAFWPAATAQVLPGRRNGDLGQPLSAPAPDVPGAAPLVDVRYTGGESYEAVVRGHRILTDQPAGAGGADSAPTPVELLVASLATCAAFYAGRYLTRHGYGRDGLTVSAAFATASDGPARVSDIRLTVLVPAGLPAGRRPALLAVVDHCTVHNTLVNEPSVAIELD